MTEIAILDDEKIVLKSLKSGLQRSGYTVRTFSRVKTFAAYLKNNDPDVVFLDLVLPDGYGLDVLQTIIGKDYQIPTIIITAHGDVHSAVSAMKMGAFDYISKPFDLDVIEILVAKACKERKLIREVEHHRRRSHKRVVLDEIICNSPPMMEVFTKVRRLGRVDATTILILGESGTGKDLLAKAIHNQSNRRNQAFIEINCAAFPENLLESELFGHERGAFTDAKGKKQGLAELADGGTLFLDEVGEMPPELQAKLLKFLETRTFRRIGGTKEIKVDLLIISSTNRDLDKAVFEKKFRKDLYYRLMVVPITIPPLRHRGQDIELLVSHYIDVYKNKFNKPALVFSQEVYEVLLSYDWPGNVRELKNLIEQLVIFSDGSMICYDDLPRQILSRMKNKGAGTTVKERSMPKEPYPAQQSLATAVGNLEKEKIRRALDACGGVKSRAARRLGISRYALLRRLKRFGDDF